MTARIALAAARATFQTVGRLAPDTAALWAEELFCRPPRARTRPSEEEFLAMAEPLRFRAEAGLLAGWSWGAGPTVLLVHGWASRAARFRVLAPALVAAGFRAVAFDGPAHGRSPGRRTTVVEHTTALLAVAGQLGPLHGAVGHSMGGAAVALALHRGLALQRAVLIAPFSADPDFVNRFAAMLHLPDPVRDRMVRNLERRFQLRFRDLYIPDLVRSLATPALVLHDAGDEEIPLVEGEAIARAWPGAILHRTEGLGHHAIMRSPEIAARVAGFMAEGEVRSEE